MITSCSLNCALSLFVCFTMSDILELHIHRKQLDPKHMRLFNRSGLVLTHLAEPLLGLNHNFQRSLRKRALKYRGEERRGEEAALLHPANGCPPQGVTEAFWMVSGTFVCRKEYTWGQILLVSVPENVSNTPFFW